MLERGRGLDPLREEQDGLAPGQHLLLPRQGQDGEEHGLPLLLALQGVREPERVDGHVREVRLLAALGGGRDSTRAHSPRAQRLELVAERVRAGRLGGQPVRGRRVLGVHFSRRVEDGRPDRLAIGGELLHEPEAPADLEDRHVDVRPVLELQEGQCRLAGDVAAVGSELVEEERHEVQVAAFPGPDGRGWGGGRRGRRGGVLEGLPDRARVEESEVPGLLPDAVLVDLELVRPEVAHRTALLVARDDVEEDDLGVHAEDLAPELGRRLRCGGLGGGGPGGEDESGRRQPCPSLQRPASRHGVSFSRGTPCSRASEDLDDGPRCASSLRSASRSRSASAGRPARA